MAKKNPQKDLDPSNRVGLEHNRDDTNRLSKVIERGMEGNGTKKGTTLNERCWTKLPCVQGSFIQCSFSDKDISWHTLGFLISLIPEH